MVTRSGGRREEGEEGRGAGAGGDKEAPPEHPAEATIRELLGEVDRLKGELGGDEAAPLTDAERAALRDSGARAAQARLLTTHGHLNAGAVAAFQ